jgi:putrescine aminotransferase
MRDPFEPLVPDCFEVPFGDLEALEKTLVEHKVAALLLEPIQAEAGVVVPPPGYLKTAQQLCTKHGALLVLDEVQTGLGRTGKLFAYEHESFVPDVLVLGKALGGSLVPISATLTTADVHDRAYGSIDRHDLHGSTFSGYSLGCRIAMETLRLLDEEGLLEAAAARGEQLSAALEERLGGHPLVRGVRGRGLLVGLELGPTEKGGWLARYLPGVVESVSRRVFGQWLALRLLERGIVCQPASLQWNVLKIEPPLTITREEIDEVVGVIADVLAEYRDFKPLLVDVGARLGKQLRAGWSF